MIVQAFSARFSPFSFLISIYVLINNDDSEKINRGDEIGGEGKLQSRLYIKF